MRVDSDACTVKGHVSPGDACTMARMRVAGGCRATRNRIETPCMIVLSRVASLTARNVWRIMVHGWPGNDVVLEPAMLKEVVLP